MQDCPPAVPEPSLLAGNKGSLEVGVHTLQGRVVHAASVVGRVFHKVWNLASVVCNTSTACRLGPDSVKL